MEAKRALVIAKLDQRHKKTTELTANGKTDSGDQHSGGFSKMSEGDFSTDFQRRFYGERSSVVEEVERLRNQMKSSERSSPMNAKLEDLINRASKLQVLLNESTSVLPSYEIRKANANLQELQEQLKQARSELQPQKRFAFTSIKPTVKSVLTTPAVRSTKQNSNGTDAIDSRVDTVPRSTSSAAAVVIQNRRKDDTIALSNADCQGKDVLLLDCQFCTIRLMGTSNTVHAKKLIGCTILSYPVSTSIFIECCQRSVFVVACQQLRMHSSVDCDLYLHVTTAAIIEDCQRLRFAPYAEAVENADQILEKSNLDKSKNTWNRVHDFNWLVADEPSPNWQILPAEQWCRFRVSID